MGTPPRIIDLKQGSDAWLGFRLKHIGASDVPIIMGVSPYMKPFALWQLKTLRKAPSGPTAAMRHGLENEAAARERYIRDTGAFGSPRVYEMTSWPVWVGGGNERVNIEPKFITLKPEMLSASLDFIGPDRIAEFKCPYNHENYLLAKEGTVPEKDWPQVQAQLLVMSGAGIEKCDYVSSYGDSQTVIHVTLDRGYVRDQMLPALDRFLTAIAENAWPQPEGEYTFTGPDELALAEKLIAAKQVQKEADVQAKRAEQEVKKLQAHILEFAGPYKRARIGNLEVVQEYVDEKEVASYVRSAYIKTSLKVLA